MLAAPGVKIVGLGQTQRLVGLVFGVELLDTSFECLAFIQRVFVMVGLANLSKVRVLQLLLPDVHKAHLRRLRACQPCEQIRLCLLLRQE